MGERTAVISYRVTEQALQDSYAPIRSIVRERLVRKLRALVPEGRIRFSVVRQPPRSFEFMALVGPKASSIARGRRQARQQWQGYLDYFAMREDGR